jgi:hypothetical protein
MAGKTVRINPRDYPHPHLTDELYEEWVMEKLRVACIPVIGDKVLRGIGRGILRRSRDSEDCEVFEWFT